LYTVLLLLLACPAPAAQQPKEGAKEQPDGRPEGAPGEGFRSLMPDARFTGWRGRVGSRALHARMTRRRWARLQRLANADMLVHWKTRDGVLEFDGQGKSICTEKEFGDFELYVDWKIPEGGVSGVYLRGVPQVQIWDTSLENLGAEVGSGGLRHNKSHPSKPLVKADKPVGEWNTFHIKMVGQRVTVKLNGKLVVNDVVLENYWEPDRPVHHRGHVELLGHGTKVWFRNIYIRELPRRKP